MSSQAHKIEETYTERMAEVFSQMTLDRVPENAKRIAIKDLIDISGLCVAARNEDYMRQIVKGWDSDGDCTVIGHSRSLDAGGAAVANGVGTHGEDFDDTLEGAPIRVAASVIPAALAVAERFNLSGERALLGIVAGLEAICRLNHVVPGAIHKAGFHPVGVIGALGASVGAATTLGLDRQGMTMAMGIAGSFSSGILEYLTDGAWTKRIHPGWAAQSGVRAAVIAREGFFAPRTLLEGEHNFFRAFGPSGKPDYRHLTEGLGEEWYMERITFKPYACGTMIHPYVDCMIRLGKMGLDAEDIVDILCETGEGLVHRLWEPLAEKHTPPSGYAAKFSMPFCMAVGFYDGDAGLQQFTDEKAKDARTLALARKIRYVIDPNNEYPRNYTGHIKVSMKNGEVHELRQPHMRGGMREPLSHEDIVTKFRGNILYGKWPAALGEKLLTFCENLATQPSLKGLNAFRQ